MSLRLDIDFNEVALRIQRYVNELGRLAPVVVRDTTRLLIGDLLKITPPKTRRQGEKAVERDVRRAMTPFEAGKVKMPRLRKLVRERNYDAVNSILKRAGSPWEVFPVSANLHQSARDKRGRVRRSMQRGVLDRQAWMTYVKKVKGSVGKLKAGWNAAYRRVGGLIPSWISRHGDKDGAVIDMTGIKDDPRIVITHTAPHNALITEKQISKAVGYRVKAMDTDIRKALARAQNAANL